MKNFKIALYDKNLNTVYKWIELYIVNPGLLWSVITSDENDNLRNNYEILLYTWLKDDINGKKIYEWDWLEFEYEGTDWQKHLDWWPVIYDNNRASFFIELDNWDLLSLDALFNFKDYEKELEKLLIKEINWVGNQWPDYDYLSNK